MKAQDIITKLICEVKEDLKNYLDFADSDDNIGVRDVIDEVVLKNRELLDALSVNQEEVKK